MGEVVAITRESFDRIMQVMIGLRFVPASTDTHWEALQDVPERVLRAAATRAAKTRNEFPTPYELRLDCDAVRGQALERKEAPDRSTELTQPLIVRLPDGQQFPIKRSWKYHCDDCSDSGWQEHWCGSDLEPVGMHRHDCARHNDHEPHSWVERCPCIPRNPDIQRRILAQARYAEQRAEQGSKGGRGGY